jgi:hypothetical protein
MLGRSKSFIGGFILGFGSGVVARELGPIVKEAASPVFRAVIKAGVVIYERSHEVLWEGVESFEDVVAEARYDYQEKKLKRQENSSQDEILEEEPPLQ